MDRYSVFLKPSAIKEIQSISLKKERQRVLDRIHRLSENPRPPGVEIVRVSDRKEVYR